MIRSARRSFFFMVRRRSKRKKKKASAAAVALVSFFDRRSKIRIVFFTLPAVADSGRSTPPTVFVGAASFSTRIL